jgi:hypothetical protein
MQKPQQEKRAFVWVKRRPVKTTTTAKPGQALRPMKMYAWGIQKQKSPGSLDQGLFEMKGASF